MEDAIQYLEKVIGEKLLLKHYARRVALAKEYFEYYTGNLDAKLKRMLTRETEEEFANRVSLTSHITGAVINSVKMPFYKAARKRPMVKNIDFLSEEAKKRTEDMEVFINSFNGDKSLDQYLEIMLTEYNFIDPNAFLIVEFQPNTETEKAKPYPFIATSEQVIDYEFINGILDYLIIRLPIKFIQKEVETEGFKYTMYNGNETIVYEQVDIEYQGADKVVIDNKAYTQAIYQVRAEGDPDLIPAAKQFGYIMDPQTNFETYLSVFDCALPYLKKTLKINSENDQSMAMMAFPQRFMFEPPCVNEGCNKGQLPDGKRCPVCEGSGTIQVHKGAQDIISLALPKSPEEMVDLEKMLVYKMPPIELLKYQREFIQELKNEVHSSIFNADVFTKSEVANPVTATEKILDYDNLNDTLYGFTRQYSQVWQMVVYFIGVFTENIKQGDEVTIEHKFPFDLKMKSMNDLMVELKAAQDSNASIATIAAIEDDINEILYSDRPDELQRIRVQNDFNPFRGYQPEDIKYLISSGYVTKFNKILYSNYADIWNTLEREHLDPWIYDMDEQKIFDLLTEKVNAIIATIDKETPKVMKLNFNQNDTQSQGRIQSGEQEGKESGKLPQQKAS